MTRQASNKKIAIVGPESTGKSMLSMQLAKQYKTTYVPEYAREYIANLQRAYTLEDIVIISKKQLELEDEKAKLSSHLLFCDTSLLVSKIWAENAFQTCPDFILQNYNARNYGLHLLMDIDLPWQYDPQREHPNLRQFFFDWYQNELKTSGANYKIISGSEETRLQNAIREVDNFLDQIS